MGIALIAPAAEAAQSADAQHPQEHPVYEGPPLSLKAALNEALDKNPELVALRTQLDVTRERPGQERALAPPMLETTIWQWPINTLNPANTNMYMFMATQELPGRGKRDLRAAVAEKDVAIAQNDIDARARHVFDEVKQAYADLFVSREAIEIHLAMSTCFDSLPISHRRSTRPGASHSRTCSKRCSSYPDCTTTSSCWTRTQRSRRPN